MKKVFYLLKVLVVIFISYTSNAQVTTTLAVKGTGVYHESKVLIRWAPADYQTWQWAITKGYHLERFVTVKDDRPLDYEQKQQSRKILADKILPKSEDEWKELAAQYPSAGIAAAAIYSPEFIVQAGAQSDQLKAYNKTIEKDNRLNFILFAADQEREVARAAGFFFEDTEIDPNLQYQYIITPNTEFQNVTIKAGIVDINPSNLYSIPALPLIEGLSGDKTATLKWSKLNLDKYFTSFNVQRSVAGGEFVSRNADPIVPTSSSEKDAFMYFSDELEENGIEYRYRVLGKSFYGFMSEPSEPVTIIGKPKPLDASPFIHNVSEKNTGSLFIEWNFPSEKLDRVQSFSIYKSEQKDGPYEEVTTGLDKSATQFEDSNVPKGAYFYIVRAYDDNNYELNSFASLGQLKDETPPDAPIGIKCQSDQTGKVIITWDPNTETDVLGYRVFFSNNKDDGFAQITKSHALQTTFNDYLPLNVLNESIFYKVIAVDYHQNYSEMSEVCIAARPDVIPPSNPVLKQAEATYDGVELSWIISSSKDVVKHELQRKASFDSDWSLLATFDPKNTTRSHLDTTGQKAYVYAYRVLATDKVGNFASSNILQAIPVRDGLTDFDTVLNSGPATPTPPVTSKGLVQYTANYNPDFIELTWNYAIINSSEYFAIYRSDSKSLTPMYVGRMNTANLGTKNLFSFNDDNVTQGIIYTYDVQICGTKQGCILYDKVVVDFNPKSPNTNNTNNNNLAMDVYSSPIASQGVVLDCKFPSSTGMETVEIYRSLTGTATSTKVGQISFKQGITNGSYTDVSALSPNNYSYYFLLCNTQTNVCSKINPEVNINLKSYLGDVSAIKSYTPNYIEIQVENAMKPGSYLELDRIDQSGNQVSVGMLGTPNLANNNYKIKDINVTIGTSYTYLIKQCTSNGVCTTIFNNIIVQY